MTSEDLEEKRQQTKASYNRLSRWYDLLAGSSEKRFTEVGLQKLDLKRGDHVLEIGFGTGNAILELARAVGATGKVVGIDLADGMVHVARAKVEQAGLSKNVELDCGDAVDLPYPDASFQAVFMSFTLELFDPIEIDQVLRESKRVLQDGGRMCVVALSKEAKENLMTKVYTWGQRNFPAVIDCRPILVQNVLLESGFHIKDITRRVMWGLPLQIALAEKG